MPSPGQYRAASRNLFRSIRGASLSTTTGTPQGYSLDSGLLTVATDSGAVAVTNYSPYLQRLGAKRVGIVLSGVASWLP